MTVDFIKTMLLRQAVLWRSLVDGGAAASDEDAAYPQTAGPSMDGIEYPDAVRTAWESPEKSRRDRAAESLKRVRRSQVLEFPKRVHPAAAVAAAEPERGASLAEYAAPLRPGLLGLPDGPAVPAVPARPGGAASAQENREAASETEPERVRRTATAPDVDAFRMAVEGMPSADGRRSAVNARDMQTQTTRYSVNGIPISMAGQSRSQRMESDWTEQTGNALPSAWDPATAANDAGALSRTIEQDARRYDGGYHLY